MCHCFAEAVPGEAAGEKHCSCEAVPPKCLYFCTLNV
jgi:hypothetical protein